MIYKSMYTLTHLDLVGGAGVGGGFHPFLHVFASIEAIMWILHHDYQMAAILDLAPWTSGFFQNFRKALKLNKKETKPMKEH